MCKALKKLIKFWKFFKEFFLKKTQDNQHKKTQTSFTKNKNNSKRIYIVLCIQFSFYGQNKSKPENINCMMMNKYKFVIIY